MNGNVAAMVERTRNFALRVLNLCSCLHGGQEEEILGSQLFRSATAIPVRYQVAQYAQSQDDFCRKMKMCEEEADETCCWLELLRGSGYMKPTRLDALVKEAHEIASIIAASCITLNRKRKKF